MSRYRNLKKRVALVATLIALSIAAPADRHGVWSNITLSGDAYSHASLAVPLLKALFWGDRASHHAPVERFQDLARPMLDRGIQLVYSDDWDDLREEVLKRYDALIVYGNATELPKENEEAILSYVEGGGGLVAIHSASAMFTNSQAWIDLVGAEFARHGAGVLTTEVVEPEHPVVAGFEPFASWDETYVHRRHNEEGRTVLTRSTHRDNEGEPITWIRRQGEGRVFYTARGHDARAFAHPGFHDLIERGIRYAAGQDVQSVLAEREIESPFAFEARSIPTYGGQGPAHEMQLPLPAEVAMERIVVPGGFRLELFAADPLIGKPLDINWDERGRTWILETSDYPNEVRGGLGSGGDRLVILEDTDGDGRADNRTVFADGLNIPTSFVFADGGVIVQMAPYTLFLQDTDGDDRADVRRVLMSGWSQADTHAGASHLTYGLDNHIYGVVGYSGRSNLRQAVWRMPVGASSPSELERIASTTNNTWGFGLSEDGLLYVSTANANPSGYVAIPERYYAKVDGFAQPIAPNIAQNPIMLPNHRRYRQVDNIGRFTAASGHALYTARSFPREYWNRIAFVSEPTGGLTAEFVLQRQEAEVTSHNPRNLLTSDDEWFSPIQAKVGPDGAVWVLDFYNFIIQHNPTPPGYVTGAGNAYETELRENEYGRIYRVVWNEAEPQEPRNLSRADLERLVATLRDENMLWRMHAQRLLVEQEARGAIPALIELVEDLSVDEIGLNPGAIHALWTLHGIGALDGSHVAALKAVYGALRHPSAGVRRNALQVLPATEEARDALLASGVLTDEDAQVRLAALLALSEMPESVEAGEAIFASVAGVESLSRPMRDAAVIAGVRHARGFLAAGARAGLDAAVDGESSAVKYGPNLVQNGSFEAVGPSGAPIGWAPQTWSGSAQHQVIEGGGRGGGNAVAIRSFAGADASWNQVVRGLEVGAHYRLSGWVKTEGLSGALGATLSMHEMQDVDGSKGSRTGAFHGTNEWTFRQTLFVAEQPQLTVLTLFGGWGQSRGSAFFDEIELRKVEAGGALEGLEEVYREVAARRGPAPAAEVLSSPESAGARPAGSEASPGPGSEVTLLIENYEYVPAEIVVSPGTTVTWVNKDVAPHTVTQGAIDGNPADRLFDSSGMAEGRLDLMFEGDTWSFTFSEPGEYLYFCIPHPYMVGKVIVRP